MNNENDYNILDCESFQSTLSSLEQIFNTSQKEIINFIENFYLENVYESSINEIKSNEMLYHEFKKNFTIDSKEIQPFWFHTTRVKFGTSFKEGIYPLDVALPLIDKQIENIVSGLGLQKNPLDSRLCDNVKTKLNCNGNSGPWGFLIKEVCFHNIGSSHNYCVIPEVVDDIVYSKYSSNYSAIIKKFQELTTPCIVKFSTGEIFHPDNLFYVLNYIYQKYHHIKFDRKSIYPYCNRGQIIKYEMIKSIEFLDSEKLHF
ncbi:MAG: hypothetical protein AB7V07_07350 [Candidatus Delongbacteria bacterium]